MRLLLPRLELQWSVKGQASFKSFRPYALTSPIAGTTRDRVEGHCVWSDTTFRVQDTGGILDLDLEMMSGESVNTIERKMEAQVLRAIGEASVVLHVVDGLRGLMPVDQGLAKILRKLQRCGDGL